MSDFFYFFQFIGKNCPFTSQFCLLETFVNKNVSNVVHTFYFCIMNEDLQNIIRKVEELYQQNGIKNITMDDVAHGMGISKKTLYHHVTDKNELVSLYINVQKQKIENYFDELSKLNLNAIEEMVALHEKLIKLVTCTNPTIDYDLKKYYPEIYKKYIEDKRTRMFEWFVENIEKGKLQGLYRDDVNPEIIARLVVSRNEFFREHDFFSHSDLTSRVFFTEIMNYHVRGIANPIGIEQFSEYLKNKNKD